MARLIAPAAYRLPMKTITTHQAPRAPLQRSAMDTAATVFTRKMATASHQRWRRVGRTERAPSQASERPVGTWCPQSQPRPNFGHPAIPRPGRLTPLNPLSAGRHRNGIPLEVRPPSARALILPRPPSAPERPTPFRTGGLQAQRQELRKRSLGAWKLLELNHLRAEIL
jgi:hypothetical protein